MSRILSSILLAVRLVRTRPSRLSRSGWPVMREFLTIATCAALVSVSGCAAAQAVAQPTAASASTVVLVMRHGEREAEPDSDPGLSAAGTARAARLAQAAQGAPVSAVFTTQFRRTRETAAPLAQSAGVPVTVRPVTAANQGSYAEELVREIREGHAGRTVAVIGHSNTVPALVAVLTGTTAPTLGESDYGDLFVVILPSIGGPARVLRTHVVP